MKPRLDMAGARPTGQCEVSCDSYLRAWESKLTYQLLDLESVLKLKSIGLVCMRVPFAFGLNRIVLRLDIGVSTGACYMWTLLRG